MSKLYTPQSLSTCDPSPWGGRLPDSAASRPPDRFVPSSGSWSGSQTKMNVRYMRLAPGRDVIASPTIRRDQLLMASQTAAGWFSQAQESLERFRRLGPDWDSYGAEPPNAIAIYWAGRVLDVVRQAGFCPERVTPSAEGGVAVTFCKGQMYADLECFNDGQILAVFSDRQHEPIVWEVNLDRLESSLERIREYFRR